MRVFAALVVLLGTVAAQPTGEPESPPVHDATHYENKYNEATQQYEAFTRKAEQAAAEAAKWLQISQANKEALDSYTEQDEHKLTWEAHVNDRGDAYDDYHVPMHNARSEKEQEYLTAVSELDGEMADYYNAHSERRGPIDAKISEYTNKIYVGKGDIQGLTVGIKRLQENIESKRSEVDKFTALLNAASKQLMDEVADFENYKRQYRDRKSNLAGQYNAWKSAHTEEWDGKTSDWNDARDDAEDELAQAHQQEYQEYLKEKEEADLLNGDKQTACCQEMTAECLSCKAGETVEVYCLNPYNVGCQGESSFGAEKAFEKPGVCCKAITAECLACSAGVSFKDYCIANPLTNGCPKIPPPAEGCCEGHTSRCIACHVGVTEKALCYASPNTFGCPHGVKVPPMCCESMTAECLACTIGVTIPQYCSVVPTTPGCPSEICCQGAYAPCLACNEGMTYQEYCALFPTTAGCHQPKAGSECCQEDTVECHACNLGLSVMEYCYIHPNSNECSSIVAL